jgi:hypothetical protein
MAFAYTKRMVQKLCFVELISDLLKKDLILELILYMLVKTLNGQIA